MTERKNVMTAWKEFNPDAKKSIKDDFGKETLQFKSKIIEYLNNGEIILTSPSHSIDVISGEKINQTKCILTDGVFSWSDSLSYYIEKYNLQLPSEFLDKILNS